jgi:hypothetical protein
MMFFRKLLGSSAPIQLLHSGTSFLVIFACARVADEVDFGHISAYFLLLTIGVSLSMQWVSLIWLREPESSGSGLYWAGLWLSAMCAATFWAVWCVYAFLAFGLATLVSALLAFTSALTFFIYFSVRRLYLLQNRLALAARLDGVRALIFALGIGALLMTRIGLSLEVFMALVLAAHLLALAAAGSGQNLMAGDPHTRFRSKLGASLRRIFGLQDGDRLNLYSAAMNILFSQASSIAAPLFISAAAFASLRAYELLLFPTFFVLQTLDPIYLNRFRSLSSLRPVQTRRWLLELLTAALLVAAPFALLYGLLLTPEWGPQLLDLLVAAGYHADRSLIHLLLLLTMLMACNGPARWAMSVLGMGRPLFIGSLVGFPLSLVVLALLSEAEPRAWIALCAKLIYEGCVLIICIAALGARRSDARTD